ncbi:MAG: hypothetical protein WCK60_00815 [Candidatus Nomurabacteria bacterium]
MWKTKLYILRIINFIFPSRCYICKKDGKTICDNCINSFPKNIDTQALYVNSIFSFKYKEIKNIIHAIKYYHRKDLIKPLAIVVADELQKTLNHLPTTINWVLVPIPMPTIRKYMRGYNQSELIAKEISEKLSIPINTQILFRTRNPKRQVKTTNRGERLKNQHNSFKVVENILNLNIILIDDVTTTGATITEARNVLIKNGAKNVIAFTIAH